MELVKKAVKFMKLSQPQKNKRWSEGRLDPCPKWALDLKAPGSAKLFPGLMPVPEPRLKARLI